MSQNETARTEAFSDGVFAIAITLLILEIVVKVPHEQLSPAALTSALTHLWPSYVAYFSSFATIGVMWLNHHRLYSLIQKNDDALHAYNLALLLGVTWIPFPTALLASQLLAPGQRIAGIVYASSFFVLAIIFNLMWRHAVRAKLCAEHLDVQAITRQYAFGPIFYAALIGVGAINGLACLIVSAAIAFYFLLPPKLWRRSAASAELSTASNN
jgi:uncharacterized membrane protein